MPVNRNTYIRDIPTKLEIMILVLKRKSTAEKD